MGREKRKLAVICFSSLPAASPPQFPSPGRLRVRMHRASPGRTLLTLATLCTVHVVGHRAVGEREVVTQYLTALRGWGPESPEWNGARIKEEGQSSYPCHRRSARWCTVTEIVQTRPCVTKSFENLKVRILTILGTFRAACVFKKDTKLKSE